MKQLKQTFLVFALMMMLVNVGWGQYSGSGTFTKITSLAELTDGYYVFAYGTTFAMNNTNAGTYFGNTPITPSGTTITNPATTIVWKIQTDAGARTIYNEASSKYVSYTGSSNAAYAVDAVTSGAQRWTFAWSSSVFTVTNVTSTTRLLQYNTSSPRFACYTGTQQNITLYKLVGPTINTTGTLSAFSTVVGTPSSTQTYTVAGSNLTNDIIITPPVNFEISTNGGTNWIVNPSTATLTQSGGVVGTTTITVRYNPGTAGSHTGVNITHTSTGATQKDIAVSGTSIATQPTSQGNTLLFTATGTTSLTFSWTAGDGSGRIVLMKQGSAVDGSPVDGTGYTASTTFGSGTEIGTGNYVVSNDASNNITVTGLTPATTYHLSIFEFNGSGATINYLTTAPLIGNRTTRTAPVITVTSTMTSFGNQVINGTSAEKDYTVSGSNLTSNITIDAPTGFEISQTSGGTFTNQIILTQSGGTVGTTTIYVRFIPTILQPYTGNISHISTGATTQNAAVSGNCISAEPTTQSAITFGTVTATSIVVNFSGGNGDKRILLVKSGSAVNSDPVDAITYTANTIYGSGDQIGTGNYVVYSSTGTTATVTNLTPGTTYHFAVYEYFDGNVSGSENYFITSPGINNQTTGIGAYTWNGATSDWQVSTNWTPTRTSPAANDILQFNAGGTVTVTNVPTQTIGQLIITNSSIVNLQSGVATLTISGGTGTDLSVEAGSQLNFNGTSALIMTLGSGTIGNILGSMSITGAAHRLTATDASSITFGSGSTFNVGTGFTGNVFGTTSLNSVIFAIGSTYNQSAGSNPFGASSPNFVVIFQSGSLFKITGNITPSFSGRTYSNFELDFPTALATTTGTSAVVMDNLTITNGTLNFNVTATPGHSIKGNIFVNTNGILNFNPSAVGTVSLNGTSAQTITNSGTLTFGSNSTIALNNSNGLVLGSDVSFNNLTMTSGKLTLGANNLIANAVSGGSSTAYVVTDGTGKLRLNSVGSSEITFPIGTSSTYNPVYITNTGTADNFSANVKTGFTVAPPDPTKAINREWDVAKGSGTATGNEVTLRFQFNAADANANFAFNGVYDVGHYIGGAWVGGTATLTGTSDPYTLNVTGITSFSPFAIGNQGALPVTLSSLNSVVAGRNIKINWVTASENNNAGFNVERMITSGTTWEKIGYVQGHGTVNTPTNYSFEDRNLQTGKYKYRLKQIDMNGNFEYFTLNGEVEIGVPKKFDLSQNYPNPFNPVTKINFDLPTDSKVTMIVYDITGREIARLVNNEYKKAGYYTTDFNAGMLSSGVYFYSLSTDAFRMTKKMVVLK